ncbi:MAG: hypothetical protein AB7H90_08310 [Alphaproteobacteria bacterium]
MTRLGAVFWGGLVLASGFATFNVKYAVQGIEDELARVQRETVAAQQESRVLTAEWAYLNQPDRLAELNRNFLQLAPMTAKQLQGRIEEIALRAPPAGIPDTMIAATPPAAAPGVAGPFAATLAATPAPAARAGGTVVAEIPIVAGRSTHAAQVAEASGRESGRIGARPADGEGARIEDGSADRAVALAEALHLLGFDAGGQNPLMWPAKAAPIAAARAAKAAGPEAGSAAARAADSPTDGAVALAEARRMLGADIGEQTPRMRLARANPASLDALISKIADTR